MSIPYDKFLHATPVTITCPNRDKSDRYFTTTPPKRQSQNTDGKKTKKVHTRLCTTLPYASTLIVTKGPRNTKTDIDLKSTKENFKNNKTHR